MVARAFELQTSRSARFDPQNPGLDLEFMVIDAPGPGEATTAIGALAPYKFGGYTRLAYNPSALSQTVWNVKVPYGVPRAGDLPPLYPGEVLSPADLAADPSVADQTDPFADFTPSDPDDPAGVAFDDYPTGVPTTGSPQQPATATAPLGPEWGFDTAGGTRTVRSALLDPKRGGVPSRYFGRAGVAVVDFKGLIGVKKGSDGKLEVEGHEAPDPKLEFSTTRTVRGISLNYIGLVARMTGSVNKTGFSGFKAGELLFLGASGSYKPPNGQGEPGAWSITYRFAASPNLKAVGDSVQVAPGLYLPVGEQKDGWDLLDVMYEDKKHPTLNLNVPTAVQFAIHRVFPRTDFRYLGFRRFNF